MDRGCTHLTVRRDGSDWVLALWPNAQTHTHLSPHLGAQQGKGNFVVMRNLEPINTKTSAHASAHIHIPERGWALPFVGTLDARNERVSVLRFGQINSNKTPHSPQFGLVSPYNYTFDPPLCVFASAS